MRYRQERIASLIKEEISKLIVREIEFPDCLMTIVDVEVDKKLEKAIVSFSVLCPFGTSPEGRPSEKSSGYARSRVAREMALKILGKNRSHLQYLLLRKINIKPMPQIVFKIDRGLEESAKIEKILLEDKIKENTD